MNSPLERRGNVRSRPPWGLRRSNSLPSSSLRRDEVIADGESGGNSRSVRINSRSAKNDFQAPLDGLRLPFRRTNSTNGAAGPPGASVAAMTARGGRLERRGAPVRAQGSRRGSAPDLCSGIGKPPPPRNPSSSGEKCCYKCMHLCYRILWSYLY